eukprot:7882-Heterococcus_DN1.PRE.1
MAAIIVVQVGQCGNQVGERLFSKLHSHFKQQQPQALHYDSSSEEGRSIFFRGAASTARAVLVDTEPKAIDATARAAGPGWRYDPRSQVTISHSEKTEYSTVVLLSSCRRGVAVTALAHWPSRMLAVGTVAIFVCCKGGGGAANNWAYGYCCYGPQCAQAVLAAVSREAEQCDHLGGIVVLHSAAGGTGSGLGSYITEMLADNYPGVSLLNSVVCPYAAGEVIVQNYNLLFTLGHLAQLSDGVLAIENDQMGAVCRE